MAFGLDYSTGRPSHSAMKAAGVKFAVRYIGSSNHTSTRHPKFITPAEYKALKAAGFEVPLVFEQGQQRATGGRTAGLADAALTKSELSWLGLPADYPVYYTVDFDTAYTAAIDAYYVAIGEVRGVAQVGSYGGLKVIKAVLDKKRARLAWQTLAWSPSWDPRAQLRQTAINKTLGGAGVDFNESRQADYGQRPVGASPPPQEENMISGKITAGKGPKDPIELAEGGPFKKIKLGWDNTRTNPALGITRKPPASIRLAMHVPGRKGTSVTLTVGAALDDKQGWADSVKEPLPAGCDRIDVERNDDGDAAVSFCAY